MRSAGRSFIPRPDSKRSSQIPTVQRHSASQWRMSFEVGLRGPVGFAPDRPGLNQAVGNESPIHFHPPPLRHHHHHHQRRQPRPSDRAPPPSRLQVWLTSQLGTLACLPCLAPSSPPSFLLSFLPPFSALVSSQSNLSGEDHRFALARSLTRSRRRGRPDQTRLEERALFQDKFLSNKEFSFDEIIS